MLNSPQDEVERYLRTGRHDDLHDAWPGEGLPARARNGGAALRGALMSTIKSRTTRAAAPKDMADFGVASQTRAKVEPMVRGLFPIAEQPAVLDVLARSVVFLTPATIEPVLRATRYLSTAWNLANMYLASCDAELLSEEATAILGLSEGTTCFVSMAYFHPSGQLDDVIVHEAAHVFHNCKRRTIGLHEVRGREWLLEIAFGQRETFAYACETYSRITRAAG